MSMVLGGCNQPPQIVSVAGFDVRSNFFERLIGVNEYVALDAYAGQELVFDIVAVDPDDDPLTWVVGPLPEGATFDEASRTFRWTPDEDDAKIGGLALYVVVLDDHDAWTAMTISIYLSYSGEPYPSEPPPAKTDPGGPR